MLKLNASLICVTFLAVASYAQDPSGEQPKGQNHSGASTQANQQNQAGTGEQAKSKSQSATGGQATGNNQQQPSSREAVPAAQAANQSVSTTVRGCVQAGDNRVTLTDSSGNTFLLRGDSSALKGEHHKVAEVSGKQLPPDSRESAAAIPTIDVTAMRHIADTCPVQIYQRGQPQAGNAKPKQPNPSTTPYGGPREGPQGEQSGPPDAVINTNGAGGAPSPGTGNTNPPPQTPPR